MKKAFLLFPLLLPVMFSCEKEIITNTDQIETALDAWEPFLISPAPGAQISLFSGFCVHIKTIGYTTDYTQTEENIWGNETANNSSTLTFFAAVDSVYLLDGQSNPIPSVINDSAQTVYFIAPLKSFAVNKDVRLMVDYHYYQNNDEPVDIGVKQRTREYIFHTTPSDTLSGDLVICEYPLFRQYNFLPDEYKYGYIKTHVKPDFLLNGKLVATITELETESRVESDILYDEVLGILKYSMPDLNNDKIYRIDFLTEKDGIQQKFYRTNYFKTSKFDSFSGKIGSILEGEHPVVLWALSASVVSMSAGDYSVTDGELLDYYEQVLPVGIHENPRDYDAYAYPKLVTVQLDTSYVNLDQYKYDLAMDLGYSVGRPSAYIGYRPVNDILHFFSHDPATDSVYPDVLLSDTEIQQGLPSGYACSGYILKSYLGTTVFDDLYYFKNQAANDTDRKDDPRVIAILNCEWDAEKFYQTKFIYFLRYKLPGIDVVTFEGHYEFGPM